jgi:hypothetical protein
MELELFAKVLHSVGDQTKCDTVSPLAMSRDRFCTQDSIKISF